MHWYSSAYYYRHDKQRAQRPWVTQERLQSQFQYQKNPGINTLVVLCQTLSYQQGFLKKDVFQYFNLYPIVFLV